MSDADTAFESKLSRGSERFLAHVIDHSFRIGRRQPEDFIRHFPPAAIMDGLSSRPQLRANILIMATGVRPQIAINKSVGSCTEDLEIALSVGETDAETVVTLFDPDDRIRYLPAKALWSYITEGEFWKTDQLDEPVFSSAKRHVAYMLERAFTDGLISHGDIIEGITVQKLAELLPREELAKIIAVALEQGYEGNAFTAQALLEHVPPAVLVEHVTLDSIWEQVIRPRVAVAQEFEAGNDTAAVTTTPNASEAVDTRTDPPLDEAIAVESETSNDSSLASAADDAVDVDLELEDPGPTHVGAQPESSDTSAPSIRPFSKAPPIPRANAAASADASPASLFGGRRRRR